MTKKELMDKIREVGAGLSPEELAILEKKIIVCRKSALYRAQFKKIILNYLTYGADISTHDFTYTNVRGETGKMRIHAAALLPNQKEYYRYGMHYKSEDALLYDYKIEDGEWIKDWHSNYPGVSGYRTRGFIKPALVLDGLLSGSVFPGETFCICGTELKLIGKYLAVTCEPIREKCGREYGETVEGNGQIRIYKNTKIKTVIDEWYMNLIREDEQREHSDKN